MYRKGLITLLGKLYKVFFLYLSFEGERGLIISRIFKNYFHSQNFETFIGVSKGMV